MKKTTDRQNSFERIYEIVRTIRKGKVMTYGQVAKLANVATPRVVGFALHQNPDGLKTPCHRVVFANGSLSKGYLFGGEGEQKRKLEEEGVLFNSSGLIDLPKSQQKM